MNNATLTRPDGDGSIVRRLGAGRAHARLAFHDPRQLETAR